MNNTENLQHKFMIGLVYPSFLGSVIYNVVDKFDYTYTIDNLLRYIVFILILILYIMDYLYTDTEEVKQNYNKKQLFLDLAIVVLLYYSIVVILNYDSNPHPELIIASTLFASKFINLLWEYSKEEEDSLAMLLYSLYSVLYFFVLLYSWHYSGYTILIVVLVSDVVISVYYDTVYKFYTSFYEKSNRLLQKIDTIPYPYGGNFHEADDEELQQLNAIAKNAYVQTGDAKEIVSLETLKTLYYTSPSSWILAKDGSALLGYVHVESVTETAFLKLKMGLIDENDFKGDAICKTNLCKQPAIIHIGSIVVAKNNQNINTVVMLLAYLLNKVLKDMVNFNTTQVFAIEYEDAKGKSHFKHKLYKYGFSPVEHTKINNGIFFIDIAKGESYFKSLLLHIAKKQKKYFTDNNDKEYIKKLQNIFTQI